MSEDHREIIAWKSRSFYTRGLINYGSEISYPTGTFRSATASLTYSTEEPAVHCGSSQLPLDQVKLATPEQKVRYLTLVSLIEEKRLMLREVERDIANNGQPVTWDWIKQHGKPFSDPNYVPVPFRSRAALSNLRKGSRVVIGVQSSRYYQIAGKVGKIVKKRSKDVIVQFGKSQWRIPYPDLKPAKEVSQKERLQIRKGSEMTAQVVGQLNKIVREELK